MKKGFFLSIFLFSVVSFASTDDLSWVKQEKIRAYWGPPVELIEPLHDAGFNVVIKRLELAVNDAQYSADKKVNVEGYNFEQAEQELKDSSALCKKLGMRFFLSLNLGAMPHIVQAGLEDNTRRDDDGVRPCPLDELYWNRIMVDRINKAFDLLEGDKYSFEGFMMDPEMYAFSNTLMSIPCYCKDCIAEFAENNRKARGVIEAEDKAKWLVSNNFLQDFDKYQFAKMCSIVKKVEIAIHSRRPDMIIGFAIWENTTFYKALAIGLSSENMPVMLVDEMPVYSGAYDEAYLSYQQLLAKQIPVPFINCPGVWINRRSNGDVPEKLLDVIQGNLYHRTIRADGYFLYASDRWGGTAEKAKPFTDVFTKINGEIDTYLQSDGTYKSPWQPQRLPIDSPSNLKSLLAEAITWQLAKEPVCSVKSSANVPYLRETEGQRNMIIFKAKQGDAIRITMNTKQLGHYIDNGCMSIYGPDANHIADVFCEFNKSVTYDIAATQTGAYAIVATAYSNSYSVNIDGAPWVITGAVVNLSRVGGRLFFHVPKNMKTLSASFGGGGEGADFTLYDPQCLIVHSKKAVRETDVFELPVAAKSGVWSVEINNIEDDTLFSIKGIDKYAADPCNLFISASN